MPRNRTEPLIKINPPPDQADISEGRSVAKNPTHELKRLADLIHYRIRQGNWPSGAVAPVQSVEEVRFPEAAAILGADFPNLRPTFAVEKWGQVLAGQVLFTDRSDSRIAHVSPIAGTVTAVKYGPRRTLSACVISRDPGKGAVAKVSPIGDESEASIRHALLRNGMWPAFRTRPFGRTPDPDARPAAIFVNAAQGDASAPDPRAVLQERMSAFSKGVQILTSLTDGIVHVCQTQTEPLCERYNRVEVVSFGGTRASGLSGTHIDRLFPVQSGRQVWTIGFQDVAAIGHLFLTGEYAADRVVAIGGPLCQRPRLVRTCLGARIPDIVAAAPNDGPRPVFLSGNPLTGHDALYLSRFHEQISVVEHPTSIKKASWRSWLSSGTGALIPKTSLERAIAQRILPVPLMRALSVGDSEAARRLGCLALVEEDVAILSRICTSGADYGVLLRHVLDELMDDAA